MPAWWGDEPPPGCAGAGTDGVPAGPLRRAQRWASWRPVRPWPMARLPYPVIAGITPTCPRRRVFGTYVLENQARATNSRRPPKGGLFLIFFPRHRPGTGFALEPNRPRSPGALLITHCRPCRRRDRGQRRVIDGRDGSLLME